MKAYAYLEKGKAGFIDVPAPNCGELDAIIRPLYLSPCTSDIHNVEDGRLAPNRVLGHEGVGEIVEVGAWVKDFKVGDRVIIPAITPKWHTPEAQRGFHQHYRGPLSGFRLAGSLDGLFSELAMVPDADANLAHLPPGIDPAGAVMISDMMTTGFYGAELAEVGYGDTVVVIGIGPVGLMSVAGAKLRGAGRILGIGTRPVCVEVAKLYGATDIISYKNGSISAQVLELTGKKGADRVIIAGGDDNSLKEAITMVKPGGNIGNVGYLTTRGDIPFPNDQWGFGMANKTIKGGLCPGGRYRMEQLTAMVEYGRVDPTPLITHSYKGFDQLDKAFHIMEEKPADLIKAVVEL